VIFTGPALRWLDFDVEARPLNWYGGDWVTKEITAIGWSWVDVEANIRGQGKVQSVLLRNEQVGGPNDEQQHRMLTAFLEQYDRADAVTGHFIRGYDLAVVNAALIEFGLPTLADKLTEDTKGDLVKFSGLSKSQENLAAMLGIASPKVQMDQTKWREANRLSEYGVELTRQRVEGDVIQHMELRLALRERGMLGKPKTWTGSPTPGSKYMP